MLAATRLQKKAATRSLGAETYALRYSNAEPHMPRPSLNPGLEGGYRINHRNTEEDRDKQGQSDIIAC